MIDHVSLGVHDLSLSVRLYDPLLATLGYSKLVERPNTVGFGKKYPEFWLNLREHLSPGGDDGTHVSLRARTTQQVEAFFACALAQGARPDGPPGLRPEYHASYFAAFIRDFDGHLVEAVTFVDAEA